MARILYIYFSSSRDIQNCNGIRWKIICKFLGFFPLHCTNGGYNGLGWRGPKVKLFVYGIGSSWRFGNHLE